MLPKEYRWGLTDIEIDLNKKLTCKIHETPDKQKEQWQFATLELLRKNVIDIHNRRIKLNMER